MPKGYWIVHVTVDDPAAYEAYRQANAAPLARHGGRFLVRGGAQEVVEGTARARSVVIEFPSPRGRAGLLGRPPVYRGARTAAGRVAGGYRHCGRMGQLGGPRPG